MVQVSALGCGPSPAGCGSRAGRRPGVSGAWGVALSPVCSS